MTPALRLQYPDQHAMPDPTPPKRSPPRHIVRQEAAMRRRLIILENREKARAEALEVRRGIDETVALSEARGEAFDAPAPGRGEQAKPVRRQSGLDWLWTKKRLTSHQMAAGLRYGDRYREATDVSLRSCAAGGVGGGSGATIQETRMTAQDDLERVRLRALNGHVEMIWLCDQVAGEGQRIRSLAKDDQLAAKKEAILLVALDLLANHYGIKT